MKDKVLAFVLACVLVLSLSACGEKKDRDDPADGNDSVTEQNGGSDTVPGAAKGRTWSSDARSGNRYGSNEQINNNHGSTFGGIGQDDDTVYDGRTGYRTEGTATWQRMLENGRVRDSDGFLLDGENSAW